MCKKFAFDLINFQIDYNPLPPLPISSTLQTIFNDSLYVNVTTIDDTDDGTILIPSQQQQHVEGYDPIVEYVPVSRIEKKTNES